jgi:hypothetical protein
METHYFCPDCKLAHREPAHAILGHIVRCLACDGATDVGDDVQRTLGFEQTTAVAA